jgi:hypothetical protein
MSDDRPARLSRRGVLAGGGALLITACTPWGTAAGPPGLTADQRLAARVADEIRTLEAAYAATIARHPTTRSELSSLAAEHDLHIAALDAIAPAPTASASAAGSPTPRTTPPQAPVRPSVPTSPATARNALQTAERTAAVRRQGQTLRAGPELGRLLASVAACEAVHAALLGGAR